MMERCTICKARLKDSSTICPRCGADLSIPLNIEDQAQVLCHEAIMQLGAGHLGDAVESVEYSLHLKRDPLAQAVWGFIRHQSLH
jgi:predicted amidophosphoribosyltransferase